MMHVSISRIQALWSIGRPWLLHYGLPLGLVVLFSGVLSAYLPGIDYRPLIIGARAVLSGMSPYGPDVQKQIEQVYVDSLCGEPCAAAGLAYPFPALLLAIPLAWLPDGLIPAVWVMLSIGTVFTGLWLLRMSPGWLLFFPLVWGVIERQVTVLLVGLLLLAVWAYQTRRWWLLGLLVVLTIAAKPQTTVLISGVLAVLMLRARQWKPLLVSGVVIGGLSLVLQPLWVFDWLKAVQQYSGSIQMMWLIAWLPVVIILVWQKQWWPAMAAGQVCLFPVAPYGYALLPLLVGYTRGSTAMAWVAIGCSWLTLPAARVVPRELALGLVYLLPLLFVRSSEVLKSR